MPTSPRGGAEEAHLVDLDGARAGAPRQHDLFAALAATRPTCKLQVAGGFRTADQVATVLDAGVARVVIGSLALTDPAAFAAMLDRFGPDRLTLALDVRLEDGAAMVATHGWEVGSGRTLRDVLGQFPAVRHLLVTDIARDGMLSGPNLDLMTADPRRLSRRSNCRPRAGSPTSPTSPRCAATGAARAIVGKAIWEDRFTVAEGVAMPAARIIPCLDVADGRVVKGVKFRDHRDVGDIVDHALRYRDEGADELVFYDITASADGRSLDPAWVRRVSAVIDIPFSVAGGIGDVDTAARCLAAGADKVSVNSPALARPDLIAELADAFGRQCVVARHRQPAQRERRLARQAIHRPPRRDRRHRAARRSPGRVEAAALGAGEIVLNCMDRDGVRGGYDLDQLARARRRGRRPGHRLGRRGNAGAFRRGLRRRAPAARSPPACSTTAASPSPT